jgi:hypothetical protein
MAEIPRQRRLSGVSLELPLALNTENLSLLGMKPECKYILKSTMFLAAQSLRLAHRLGSDTLLTFA